MNIADDLLGANDPAEILLHVSRATWVRAHDGAECPDNRISAPKDLVAWRSEWPADTMDECARRLADLLRPSLPTRIGHIGMSLDHPRARFEWAVVRGDAIGARMHIPVSFADADMHWLDSNVPEVNVSLFMPLIEVHATWWCPLPEPRPRHPLAPLVDAWQRLASVVVPLDVHDRAIIPHSLRDSERHQGILPLRLDRTTPLGLVREHEQGILPFAELQQPAPSLVPPVPWLSLCEEVGSLLAQGLFVELLTAVPRDGREWTAAPPVTLRNLFEWLWPRYYDIAADRMRGGYNRTRHLVPLRRALIELDNMRIVYGRYECRLIRVDDLPTAATRLDDLIRFHVRHLPKSDHGPMIDRVTTRRWRLVSAPAWRGTIRLAYLWDEAKARNRGARICATRPMVARVPGGTALLGPDGETLRDRRGAVVTDWSDRRAVMLGADGKPVGDGNPPAFERNPAADRVPMLGPDDLIRLTFDGDLDLPASTRRKRLHDAREAIRAKEAAGEVVIEVDGDGWRIIEARR